ncbi:hypothetical protein C0J50_18520 [Silurus asotus]|uniref:Uncharacterized protein n=1 Tax=Silurus asotus TaxID=30991 RepID=A0AAD5FMS3_SILAS|nr:hypothetical protein C0J50_18520 [Silurus asotus]
MHVPFGLEQTLAKTQELNSERLKVLWCMNLENSDVSMQSFGGEEHLDGVHCLWPLCPHPCCWETERRIATGAYRLGVERSPCLTVVDVSEWAGKRMRPVRPDRRNLSGINSQVEPLQKDTDTKTKNPCFPVITSAPSESHTRESGTRNKAVNNRKGTTKKRVRFQLFHSPVRFHSSQQAESVSAAQLEAGAGDDAELLSDPSAFLLKNRPAIFHGVQERAIRTASQEAPASLYKLDSKTAEEDVDWDGLRIQPNLWKRHVSLEGFSPPGGARGIPETGSSYPGSKASSDRTICSPQCAEESHTAEQEFPPHSFQEFPALVTEFLQFRLVFSLLS